MNNEQPQVKIFDDGSSRVIVPGQRRTIRMDSPVMGDKPAPWQDEMSNWDGYHWRVTLRYTNRQYTLDFWTGSMAGEPHAGDVLGCILSDSAGYENARDFEDWAADYGYDPDSHKVEKLYRTVRRQAARAKQLLGEDLYETALWGWEHEIREA
ncbi:MAG TPA: hypothetical protein PKD55_00050 [Bellilinea sp.]|nr:hypothetical protein [Bellilinea sp.]